VAGNGAVFNAFDLFPRTRTRNVPVCITTQRLKKTSWNRIRSRATDDTECASISTASALEFLGELHATIRQTLPHSEVAIDNRATARRSGRRSRGRGGPAHATIDFPGGADSGSRTTSRSHSPSKPGVADPGGNIDQTAAVPDAIAWLPSAPAALRDSGGSSPVIIQLKDDQGSARWPPSGHRQDLPTCRVVRRCIIPAPGWIGFEHERYCSQAKANPLAARRSTERGADRGGVEEAEVECRFRAVHSLASTNRPRVTKPYSNAEHGADQRRRSERSRRRPRGRKTCGLTMGGDANLRGNRRSGPG